LTRPRFLVPRCSGLRLRLSAGHPRQFFRLAGSLHGLFLRIVGPWSAIFAAGRGGFLNPFTKGNEATMISIELIADIRRLFYAEHWKIGTIAAQLDLHPDTVRAAIEAQRFSRSSPCRAKASDPYLDFIQQTLRQYPRLGATRLHQMLQE